MYEHQVPHNHAVITAGDIAHIPKARVQSQVAVAQKHNCTGKDNWDRILMAVFPICWLGPKGNWKYKSLVRIVLLIL